MRVLSTTLVLKVPKNIWRMQWLQRTSKALPKVPRSLYWISRRCASRIISHIFYHLWSSITFYYHLFPSILIYYHLLSSIDILLTICFSKWIVWVHLGDLYLVVGCEWAASRPWRRRLVCPRKMPNLCCSWCLPQWRNVKNIFLQNEPLKIRSLVL